jgi:hypothetical protein
MPDLSRGYISADPTECNPPEQHIANSGGTICMGTMQKQLMLYGELLCVNLSTRFYPTYINS